jgi:hypothetical protein
MRWLFVDSNDREETARRESVLRRIDRWWQAFCDRQHDLKAVFASGGGWSLADWMQDKLQAINPNLMWEFGPALQGDGHRLVITPETQRQLRPLVDQILARAPALPGWEFYGHRLPECLNDVVETVQGLVGGDISKTVVDARHDGHRRVSLTFYTPECKSRECDSEQVQMAAFVGTESLLGEALLDRWIGTIDVAPLTPDKPRGDSARAIPFARLQPTVEAIVGCLIDQLPAEPCYRYVPQGRWSSYEMGPEQAADYPGRADLYVAISGRPDVFETLHGGSAFYSDTHSRCGETFCYLKIDGAGESMSIRAKNRELVESAIDGALVPAELGCVVGGGTGLRYSYIDLALTDVAQAIDIIRHIAARFQFPQRSWLLFCDDELADEWVALTATAPAPPVLAQ